MEKWTRGCCAEKIDFLSIRKFLSHQFSVDKPREAEAVCAVARDYESTGAVAKHSSTTLSQPNFGQE